MPDFLDVLKARQTPIVKGGVAHLVGAGYAQLSKDGTKATYADPLSQKVESDDAAMRHRFRISTPAVDRMGDVVMPRGCEKYLDRYAKNPQVLFGHNSNAFPVARSVSPEGGFGVLVRDDGLFADAYFHNVTAEAAQCYELVKLGYLNATSIGFRPLKATLMPDNREKGSRDVLDFEYPGLVFQEWELLEFSIVPVPANQEALDGLKSWMGKASGAESPLVQSIKAMLCADGGKSVTVTVPAEPPKEEKKVELVLPPAPVTKVSGVTLEPFSPAEVEAVVAKLTEPKVEIKELVVEDPRVKDLEAKLDAALAALEARFAALPKELPAAPPPADPVEDDKKNPPPGAKALQKLHKLVCGAMEHCSAQGDLVEHPKAAPFLKDQADVLDGMARAVHKFAKKTYPDHFPDDGAKDEPAPVVKVEAPAAPPAWAASGGLEKILTSLAALKAAKDENAATLRRLTGK